MVASVSPVTGAVLVGGASSRMGSDKAALVMDGSTMLERTLSTLRSLCSEVMVVGAVGQRVPELSSSAPPARIVHDHRANAGPLAGLEAALAACHTELLIAVAVDMPWLDAELLALQVAKARANPALDVVTLRGTRGLEPLHAVYRLRVLPRVQALLDTGERSLLALLAHARTGWPVETEVAAIDPAHRSAWNANTPAALREALGAGSS